MTISRCGRSVAHKQRTQARNDSWCRPVKQTVTEAASGQCALARSNLQTPQTPPKPQAPERPSPARSEAQVPYSAPRGAFVRCVDLLPLPEVNSLPGGRRAPIEVASHLVPLSLPPPRPPKLHQPSELPREPADCLHCVRSFFASFGPPPPPPSPPKEMTNDEKQSQSSRLSVKTFRSQLSNVSVKTLLGPKPYTTSITLNPKP